MDAKELASLYDDVASKQAEKGVKGEKASEIRDVIRKVVEAKKAAGITELSQATLRNVVRKALSTTDAEGKIVEFKLDQSYFSTIIANMYETQRDEKTGAVTVLTDTEKPPKVRTKKSAAETDPQ